MNTMVRKMSRKPTAYGGRAIRLKKTMRMSLTIIAAFIVCYLPTVIVYVTMACMVDKIWIRSFMTPLTEMSIMGNSLLNPLIYCLRLQAVREEIIKTLHGARQVMWRKIQKQRRVTSLSPSPETRF